jgi:hypothetical protein
MPGGFQFKKLVNGEEVWKLWNGVDQPQDLSLAQIYAKYKREGNINPKTGKPVTRAGLCVAAWNYAFEHMKETIPQWITAWEQHGDFYNKEDAIKIFVERAKHNYKYSKIKFNKFIEKNNLQAYV